MRHLMLVSLAIGGLLQPGAGRQPPLVADAASPRTEQTVPMHATGTFTVQITPLAADEYADAQSMGRMHLDKQFTGDIVGAGKGQMLTGMGSVPGSAAYSAIERVTGSVHGRSGSFMLQHTGVMHDGAQELSITIVPGTGTGALTGIAGTFALRIENKVHHYDLAYTLPPGA
jgi:hypothetical protein